MSAVGDDSDSVCSDCCEDGVLSSSSCCIQASSCGPYMYDVLDGMGMNFLY